MRNSPEKRADKFFDEKMLSRFAVDMCGDSEDSSYHVLYWYASKAGIDLEKGYSFTVIKKLVIKVLSNLYTIFKDIIESQTSEKPELPAKALESLGYLAHMYFNRETLVDKYVDDYNIFLFIKIMLRKLYPYALGLEKLEVGKCPRCGTIFAKREGRQRFCCTRCSNNTRSDRYRSARLSGKTHSHDDDSIKDYLSRDKNNLGDNLNRMLSELKEKAGMSATKVAEILGIDKMQLSNWRRGKIMPHKKHIKGLAEFFGVSPLDLFKDPVSGGDSIEGNNGTEEGIHTHSVAPGSREGNFLQAEGEQEASKSSE